MVLLFSRWLYPTPSDESDVNPAKSTKVTAIIGISQFAVHALYPIFYYP